MNLLRTTIAALLVTGIAHAQTATPPTRPVPAVKATPATPAYPARSVDREDRTPTDDESLALAALEGLMAQPSARSLPILKKVMAGSQSTLVKRRALFVLGQIGTAEARDILLQTARTNGELRDEAIRSIGISGDPTSLDALAEIYKAGDEDTKKQILQSWMIAGRKEAVYQAALNAKTDDEAAEAIRMLGVMGAKEELRKLGDRPKPTAGLLEAYAISGDLAGLRKIADGNGDHELRVNAVSRIGIIHGDDARAALRDIYTRTTDAEIREAALQGMLISGDDKGVLALYRAAKTNDEKRTLLRTLSVMDSDAALEAIDATLEKK
ncbi:MAG TPA: HEAT repeat domain-containing protein [Steroidobacteraceae bacterium]|nr:HEAT repeat domain-containing protein [Steroidobacteraceae bacterium]